MGKIEPLLSFYKDSFGIKKTTMVDIPVKKKKKKKKQDQECTEENCKKNPHSTVTQLTGVAKYTNCIFAEE